MARQGLRWTKEVTPGTFPGSPAGGTQEYIRLVGDDAYPGRVEPNTFFVRDAAGSNRNVAAGMATWKCQGSLSTLLYYAQAKNLVLWACNIISDGAGGFKPAFTGAFDHYSQMEDAGPTVVYDRSLGCVCDSVTIKGTNTGDGVKITFAASFLYTGVATITGTDFPPPALTLFPAGSPAVFPHVAGNFSLGGARTGFRSFEITVKHILDQIYDESPYPQAIKWCGRDVTLKVDVRHRSQADRTAFNAVSAQTSALSLFDGTTTIAFNFQTASIISGLTDSQPLAKAHYQSLDATVLLDASTGTDLTVTVSP